MLDFSKLMPQLQQIDAGVVKEQEDNKAAQAYESFGRATADPDRFEQRLNESRAITFWPLCKPLEPLGTHAMVAPWTEPCSAIAVDGSQIMPSHHEVYNCYLINIGKAAISYGAVIDDAVLLESVPYLHHSAEDLYPLVDRRRVHVDEQFVSLERALLELKTLSDLSADIREKLALPAVAFVDGSLIQWSYDQMPESYQSEFSLRLSRIFDSFQKSRIPVIGYISQTRSADIVNALRVWNCPFPTSDCHHHCGRLHEEEYPCSTIWPCTDRQVLQAFLEPHERTAMFMSMGSHGPVLPERHKSCFVYVNTGQEIARLEFPYWLAQDMALLEQAIAITIAQANKGGGYPICLAEAHNLAVVRSSDRAKFFDLIARHLVEMGVPRVRVSPKETGKRRGII